MTFAEAGQNWNTLFDHLKSFKTVGEVSLA